MDFTQVLPKFVKQALKDAQSIRVLSQAEAKSELAPDQGSRFGLQGKVVIGYQTYLSARQAQRFTITQNCNVSFSESIKKLKNYWGIASGLLASSYFYNVSTINPPKEILISADLSESESYKILNLTFALLRSRMLANGRGDKYSSPDYFVQLCQRFAKDNDLEIIVLRGSELKKQGMNLFHAVGRASSKQPAMINIAYRGNNEDGNWLSLVGKGVCFDSGGLDIKSTEGMKTMFLDKSGACSCLVAFEQIVKERLKINVTVTLGMVENFISGRSYRPSDIIQSKKGITVEIADTDAEGRLVLADCMTWTQQYYKVSKMVELSTLTYSVVAALGTTFAGIFGNSPSFNATLQAVGELISERGWILPLEEEHREMIESKVADCISDINDGNPGASIAAAFLQKFVEEGVEWIHLDVGGTCINVSEARGTGFGSRLLLQIARRLADF